MTDLRSSEIQKYFIKDRLIGIPDNISHYTQDAQELHNNINLAMPRRAILIKFFAYIV